MKKENTAVEVKPSFLTRFCEFLSGLITSVEIPPHQERWGDFPMNHNASEKHWRYYRSHYGVDRSIWML